MPTDQPIVEGVSLDVPSRVITDIAKLTIEINCHSAMQGSSISQRALGLSIITIFFKAALSLTTKGNIISMKCHNYFLCFLKLYFKYQNSGQLKRPYNNHMDSH